MKRGSKLLIALGVLLILGSLAALLGFRFYGEFAQKQAAATVKRLNALLPAREAGIPEQYSNMEMPSLQLEGQNLIALVEFPDFDRTLPVRSSWDGGKVWTMPARFCGTAYDGSLVIGGSDQPGQFDFFGQIELGAAVKLTDMMGREFSYTVTRIDRAEKASGEKLTAGEWELTLFVRDSYSLEYTLVRCSNG